MEVNELRIGNLVNVIVSGKGNKASTVESISYDRGEGYSINLNIGYRRAGNDAITGIPLTEEWLLKFGFQKVLFEGKEGFCDSITYELEYGTSPDGVFICYESDDFSCSVATSKRAFEDSPDYFALDVDLSRNVHQLQNLYFALTGSELEIK